MPLEAEGKHDQNARFHQLVSVLRERDSNLAPRAAGVYGIRNAYGSMVYIGQSTNIEERLFEHERGESDQSGCISRNSATQYSWILESGKEARLRLESALIARYSPICNG